jgi:hypothetical protein
MSLPLKSALRAPEGKWVASSERRPSTNFQPDLQCVLSYAEVENEEGCPKLEFLIFCVQHFIYICYPQAIDRVRMAA